MGIGGISVGSLLVILLIVLLLFGTKKLRNVGTDLGGAIKGFRSAMKDGEKGGESDEASGEESGEGKEPAQLQESAEAESGKKEQTQQSREHSS